MKFYRIAVVLVGTRNVIYWDINMYSVGRQVDVKSKANASPNEEPRDARPFGVASVSMSAFACHDVVHEECDAKVCRYIACCRREVSDLE